MAIYKTYDYSLLEQINLKANVSALDDISEGYFIYDTNCPISSFIVDDNSSVSLVYISSTFNIAEIYYE